MKLSLLQAALYAGLAFLASCANADFRGDNTFRGATLPIDPAVDVSENQDRTNNPRPGGSNPDGTDQNPNDPANPIYHPVKEVLNFKCAPGQDASIATIDYTGDADKRVHAQIQGEFCPQSMGKLNIVVVVDFSSSMGRHYVTSDNLREGFDPIDENGSCGRLRAIDTIYKKIQASTKPGDQVNIGLVAFAGGVLRNYSTASLISDREFAGMINRDSLCSYVAQSSQFANDPGAVSGRQGLFGGNVDPSTNYQAAFDRTRELLAGQNGRNVVYFISDGEPTSPFANPVEAGIQAGERLRTEIANLTVNGLLLGEPGQEAFEVLRKVTGSTGSDSRVVYAKNAAELETKILTFPEAVIDETSGVGRVFVEPYPEKALGLAYLRALPGAAQPTWEFRTQPLVLLGRPGETVDNRVVVEAKGVDGSTHSAIITVRYTQP